MRIEKINGRIGATVDGLSLAARATPQVVDRVREALFDNAVLIFRDQQGVSDDEMLTFVSNFGVVPDVAHPNGPGPNNDRVSEIVYDKEYRTDHWHTDATTAQYPPGVAMLWPVAMPSAGGDTLWANTSAAYDSMPESLQHFAEELWLVHSNRYEFADPRSIEELPPVPDISIVPDNLASMFTWQKRPFETVHPLVTVHPDTGKKCLLVGTHARHVLGYAEEPSDQLRRLFQSYISTPENTLRWHWKVGDVAMFDNRLTQHYAVADYHEERTMHRVSLAGGAPVSVNGQSSYPRFGDSGYFAPDASQGAAAGAVGA